MRVLAKLLILFMLVAGSAHAQSYTACEALIKPVPLSPATNNSWGPQLNTNFDLIDTALAASLRLSVAGSSNINLKNFQGSPDQSRYAYYNLTGILTGNITVFFPSSRCSKFTISNNTIGTFSVTIAVGTTTPLGTSVAIPQGGIASLISDGTNITNLSVSTRTKLYNTASYYYSSSGNSTNPCTSIAPCDSPQTVSNLIQSMLDLNGQNVQVNQIGYGTFPSLIVAGPYVGDVGCGVNFTGSPSFAVTAATNTAPIQITTIPAHGYRNGQHVLISGVSGNTAANGAFMIANATTNTFTLQKEVDGSSVSGNGSFSGQGAVSSPRATIISGGSNPAIEAVNGACFNVSGYSVTSSGSHGMMALLAGRINSASMIDFGQTSANQLYCTRKGYVEIDGSFSISGGSANDNWGQASHGGECRKVGEGFFTASPTWNSVLGFGQFVLADYGDYVETGGVVGPSIIAATNATPIVVTTSGAHRFTTGEIAVISGAQGNTAANGAWTVTVTGATTFSLNNSAGNGSYTGGGVAFDQGFTWNLQGFTVPASGSLQAYSCFDNASCQANGNAPPPAGYLPGQSNGTASSGNGSGAEVTVNAGNWLGLFGDSNSGTCWFAGLNQGAGELGCLLNNGGMQLFGTPFQNGTMSLSGGVMSATAPAGSLKFCAYAINFNNNNSDTAITISIPTLGGGSGPGNNGLYSVEGVWLGHATHSLTSATLGVYQSPSAGGLAIVTTGAITVSASAANSTNNAQALTINGQTITAYNFATLYAHVGTAEGSAATGDVCVLVHPTT